jgi:FkbM family methyltransferase
MNPSSIFARMHRVLGQNRSLAWLAAKVRNQANSIIASHLGESPKAWKNGEYALIDLVAPHCRTFVDVGAHIGDWSDYFLAHSDAIGTLYEPSKSTFEVLTKKWNGGRVRLRNCAIGDRAGTAFFIEEAGNGQTSSLLETHSPCEIQPSEVQVCTIDDEFLETAINIDFLKIDAEGNDCRVLQGATQMLTQSRVQFIQFEYNSNWIDVGSSLKEALRLLNSFGYQVYLTRRTGLHKLNYDFWGDYFRYSNFFAFQQESRHLVQHIIGKRI